MSGAACELCEQPGGELVFQGPDFRVILIDEPDYPGFCRVVWNWHLAEMTDLVPQQRSTLMQAVCKVEAALHEVMQPDKINLASLGNMTPHLHWHVIPRYRNDRHFPAPVWADAQRPTDAAAVAKRAALLPALRVAILRQFS
jgi:diadenosine tetraphosphate (Ap4A) HIT family hydrolase